MTRRRAMTSAVWERRFQPVTGPDGSDLWQRYADVAERDPHTVWSIVEGDTGTLYVVPGFHVVNHLGYAVTERPWTEADERDNLHAVW